MTTSATSSTVICTLPGHPGLCFWCVQSGHWRADSKTVVMDSGALTNDRISIALDNHFIDKHRNTSSSDINILPVGKLKSCYNHCVDANASMLDVVKQEYKISFRNVPTSVLLKNTKTARENPQFVSQEIENCFKWAV